MKPRKAGRWSRCLGALALVGLGVFAPLGGAMAVTRASSDPLVVVERAWPPTLHVVVQLQSGALADPTGLEGRAALCWDAAVRAGGGLDRKAFATRLEALGARLDADVGRHGTQIAISGLAEHADAMFALLADVVLRPGLAASDVDEAREQLRAGIAAREDDDEATASDALVRYALRGDVAGRPIDGDPATLGKIDAKACRALVEAAVAGVRVDIGVGGALDAKTAHALTRKHFAPLLAPRRAAGTAANRSSAGPGRDGRRLLLIDHPGRNAAQVALAIPTSGATAPGATALVVADAVLGGAFTSRLSHQIRELRGWTYSIGSHLQAGPRHGLWSLAWAPRNAVVAKSIDLALRQLELAALDGATRREVAFARDFLRGSQRQAVETAGEELAARLRVRALGLPDDWLAGFEGRLAAVDGKATAAAMKRLAPSDVVVVVVGDAARLRPQLEAMASGFAVEVLPRGGVPELTRQPGRAAAPTPARPQVREEGDDEIGPDFDEKGEVVDAPPPVTPTADESEDDGDDEDADGDTDADDAADESADAAPAAGKGAAR